jgi:hypothetical protein
MAAARERLIALVVLCLCLAAPGRAQNVTGSLEGWVAERGGPPLRGCGSIGRGCTPSAIRSGMMPAAA